MSLPRPFDDAGEAAVIPLSDLSLFMDDLKRHLNITKTTHDGELADILESAFELAEAVAGRSLYPGTTTEVLNSAGVLTFRPVVAITSTSSPVTYTSGGVVAGYVGTTVTYTYGQTEPTPAQRLAVLLIAAHLWETQRGVAPTSLQGDDEATFSPGYGFAVPNRARDLLRPPTAVSGIA